MFQQYASKLCKTRRQDMSRSTLAVQYEILLRKSDPNPPDEEHEHFPTSLLPRHVMGILRYSPPRHVHSSTGGKEARKRLEFAIKRSYFKHLSRQPYTFDITAYNSYKRSASLFVTCIIVLRVLHFIG